MIEVAKEIAGDLDRGEPSLALHTLGLVLSQDAASVPTLLDVLLSEVCKKRPSDRLVTVFLLMLERLLTEARMAMEADPRGRAAANVADVRRLLVAAGTEGRVPADEMIAIAQQFAAAKLDLGDELSHVVFTLSEQATDGDDVDPGDIAEQFATLAEAFDHDPFLIQTQISEQLVAFPDEHKGVIFSAFVDSDVPSMRDAAVGWLLEPNVAISRQVAERLAAAAADGHVSGESADRLVLMRPWLAEPIQASLDAAVRACRQSGKVSDARPAPQIRAVIASGCDGAGAQSFFVLLKRGRKLALGSLLVKHGFGVRDAWVRDGLSQRESDEFVAAIVTELDPFDATLEIIQAAVSHGLAVSLEAGEAPPFGLVQFLEAIGLTQVRPERLAPAALIADLLGEVPAERQSAKAVARALSASKRWPTRYEFLQSWFEQDQATEAVVGAAGAKKERHGAVLRDILLARRARWAELLAWTAKAAQHQSDGDDWIDLALIARELASERPLAEIPVADWIAKNTIAALSAR